MRPDLATYWVTSPTRDGKPVPVYAIPHPEPVVGSVRMAFNAVWEDVLIQINEDGSGTEINFRNSEDLS